MLTKRLERRTTLTPARSGPADQVYRRLPAIFIRRLIPIAKGPAMNISDRFFRERAKRLKANLQLTNLEDRVTPSTFRSIDGTMNNVQHNDWGSTGATQV